MSDARGKSADPENIISDMRDEELLALVETALDRMSVEDLTAVMEMAQDRRRDKQDEAKQELLREFRERAAGMGIPLESLFPALGSGGRSGRSRSGTGGTVAPKYRGPNGEEWSGRGILPKWLRALEAEGRSREEFKID